MELILPPNITRTLNEALSKAGSREIGGILMGEHITENRFQVSDITVQYHGGSFAAFLRVVQEVAGPLRRFFRVTNHDYTRYNYLGEWHSHPSFSLTPSSTDRSTMHDIVKDPRVGANFVVLLIIRLADSNLIKGSVTVYQPGGVEYAGQLVWEPQ